jgi:hypothetical protein
MKLQTYSPQKKMLSFCVLILVVVIILVIDHIKLRAEIAQLKKEIPLTSIKAPSKERLVLSNDLEQNVNDIEPKIKKVRSDLDNFGYLGTAYLILDIVQYVKTCPTVKV